MELEVRRGQKSVQTVRRWDLIFLEASRGEVRGLGLLCDVAFLCSGASLFKAVFFYQNLEK